MLEKEINQKASQQAIINNPFPGLRPFSIDESHLFFGREGQSDEVLLKLSNHKFVGVIGPSGSGKSSFIYCGVLPILYGGFLAHKGSDWNVMVMRPGGGPIENLADAILREDPNFVVADKEEKIIRKTITSTLLKSSSLGLVEALTQSKRNKNKNFLLLVDQFEELFRFQKADLNNAESLNEALAFVNLLSETVNQNEVPVYVAITMRSDFIGDCAQFPDLTSLINDSHYLIPQMTREQKRTAILGPVAVGGGKIAPRLVQQLLNDLGDKSDQLPILQHALMRTWDYWAKTREGDEPMDLLHYEAIGSMSEALSQHANEAFDELNDEQRRICESIFRSITLKKGDSDGIRRPTRISELASIADTSVDEVIMVVEKFREPGRSLLTPPPHITLNANSVVDISHESLMRIWVRLKNWVEDEGASVQMYMRLAEAGAMYQIGKAGLWRQPDLQMALNWQQKQKPTLIWGQRYDLAYERTMVFLENSKQEYETEQRAKELEQKRALRRSRIVAITLGTAAVICLVMLLFAFLQLTNTKRQTEIAEQEKVKAQKETKRAEKLKIQAESATQEANAQTEAAKIAQAEADNSALAAKIASEKAKRSEQIALSQKEAADKAKREAEGARIDAEESKDFALSQASIAQEQTEKAQKLRMLSISQSMSVKSIQMQEDDDLKGLLAVQSYQYNREFGGNAFSSDVYNALYYSLKSLKGDSLHRLWGHTDQVRSIAFSNDGQWMYSAGSDGKILRWKSGQTNNPELIVNNYYVNKVLGISPDNKWLVCAGENGNIQLFDLTQNEIRPRLLVGHIGEITDLVFLPDSKGFISTAIDKKVMLCDFANFTTLATLESIGRSLSINSQSNQLAIGSSNGRLVTLNLNNKEEKPITVYTAPSAIWSVLYSPDGKQLAFGDEKGALKIWSTQVNALGKTFSGHTQRINDLAYTSDSKMLASASYDGSARIIILSQPDEQPIVLRDHPSWVWTLAFDKKNENLFTASKATANLAHSFRYWPLNMGSLSAEICENLERNMSDLEWDQYVGTDIDYVSTCQGQPKPSSSK